MTQYAPGEVAELLGVSASSVRRMAATFESVMGPLPRSNGPTGPRVWPIEAFRQLEAAHRALTGSGGMVTSLEHALTLIRDGSNLPVRAEQLDVQDRMPDTLADLLAEVRALRALAEAQGRELADLRALVQDIPAALPAPAAQAPSGRSDGALRDAVQDAVRGALDPERLRVALHATRLEPERPEPRRGWLARLLGR